MKRFRIIFLLIFISLFAGQNLFAQYKEEAAQSGVGIPFFMLAMHKQYNQDLQHTNLMLMANFLYDDLTFVKSDTAGYDADFELLLAVYDENDNVILSRTLNKKVHLLSFAMTNNRKKKILLKTTLTLLPGKYRLLVKATDLNSNKSAQRRVDVKVSDFTKQKLSISGLSFIKVVSLDSLGKMIDFVPTFGNNFNLHQGCFYIYSDIYSAAMPGKIELNYQFSGIKGGMDLDTTIVRDVTQHITPVILKVEKKRLKLNKYHLELIVKSGSETVKKVQTFSFFWTEMPTTSTDLKMALHEMTYILSQDSLKKYEKAPLVQKQAFFNRFWKTHDPDPSTAKNELKNEYFRRVNYANRQFSVMGQKGWLTDRGRILIKFGFPDDIERHPFELGTKPYEIWRYYALRKTFLFEDMTGFGDYRLDPAYLDMEFR